MKVVKDEDKGGGNTKDLNYMCRTSKKKESHCNTHFSVRKTNATFPCSVI